MKLIKIITMVLLLISSVAIAADGDPPDITSTYPSNRAGDIPTGAMISVTFDEPMDPSSFSNDTFYAKGDMGTYVQGVVNSYGGRTATLYPFNKLQTSTTYYVTVTSQVRDATGTLYGRDYSWSFTTGMK